LVLAFPRELRAKIAKAINFHSELKTALFRYPEGCPETPGRPTVDNKPNYPPN
jgi:hypothetical protein